MGVITIQEGPITRVMKDGIQIASDDIGDLGVCGQWLLQLREAGVNGGRVAHLGGGLCCFARMLGQDFTHTVYEIEPDLERFCPPWADFVLGDWRKTYDHNADIVVVDTGEILSKAEMASLLPALALKV